MPSVERQVYVQLELDLGNYTGRIPAAVAATKTLDEKVKELDKDLGGVDRALDKTGRNMVETAAETGLLNRRLAETRDRLRDLTVQFDATGDSKLLRTIRQTRTELSQLERMAKDLAKTVENEVIKPNDTNRVGFFGRLFTLSGKAFQNITKAGEDAGNIFSGSFGATFFNALKAIFGSPVGIAALIAAIVAFGTMIGGALLTGIGLSGLAVGIIGVFSDPRIKNSLSQFGTELKTALVGAAEPFIDPFVKSINYLRKGFADAVPGIKETLAALAPELEVFAKGLNGFFSGFTTGLEHAMVASKPLIDEFSRFLPELGDAFGSLFETIGKNSSEARDGLKMFDDVLLTIIISTRELITVFSRLWDVIKYINPLWLAEHAFKEYPMNVGKIATAVNNLTSTAPAIQALQGDFAGLAGEINKTQMTADTLAGAMVDKVLGPTLALDKATNEFDKSLITLGDTLEANGGHLSEHVKQLKKTETGAMQNKDAILAVVEANLRVYDSQIAVGVAAEDAAKKYDENTKALEDQLRAAGYTTGQIDDLIGKYRGVPKNINTSIALLGLTQAINDLNFTLQLINGLNRTVTVHVRQVFDNPNIRMPGTAQAQGGIRMAAEGFIVPPRDPGTVLIGEPQTGGEALIPLRGISQMRAAELGRYAMSGYGLDVVPRGYRGGGVVNVIIAPKDGALGALLDLIDVRVEHGNQAVAAAVSGGVRL